MPEPHIEALLNQQNSIFTSCWQELGYALPADEPITVLVPLDAGLVADVSQGLQQGQLSMLESFLVMSCVFFHDSTDNDVPLVTRNASKVHGVKNTLTITLPNGRSTRWQVENSLQPLRTRQRQHVLYRIAFLS